MNANRVRGSAVPIFPARGPAPAQRGPVGSCERGGVWWLSAFLGLGEIHRRGLVRECAYKIGLSYYGTGRHRPPVPAETRGRTGLA